MTKKAGKQEREIARKCIAQAIAVQWESLRTHLGASVKVRDKDANELWHSQCCLDYAFTIHVLTKELHRLNKIDFPDKFEAK